MNYVSTHLVTRPTKRRTTNGLYHDFRLRDPKKIKNLVREPDFEGFIFEPDGQMMEKYSTADVQTEAQREAWKKPLWTNLEERRKIQDKTRAENFVYPNPKAKGATIKNYFVSGVITYSPEGIKDVPDAKLFSTAIRTVKRFAEELNVRLVYLVLHRDETTRHFHYTLEGTDKDTGAAVASRINKKMLRRMQDIAGEETAEIGLVRGRPAEETKAKHKTIYQMHKAAEADLDRLKKELEDVKEELKKTRLTMKEREDKATEELKKLDEERRKWRQEKKDLLAEIKKAKVTIERMRLDADCLAGESLMYEAMMQENKETLEKDIAMLKQEKEPLEAFVRETKDAIRNNRNATKNFLLRLRYGGAPAVSLARRTKTEGNKGDWHEEKRLDLSKMANPEGTAADLAQKPGEWHVRVAAQALTPLFCLDDLTEDTLALARQRYGLLAAVETSPGKYQGWISFDMSKKREIKADEWETVMFALSRELESDRAALTPGHAFRVPGFTRTDGSGWTARLADGDGVKAKGALFDQLIERYRDNYEAEKNRKKRLAERAGFPIATAVPDADFTARWERRYEAVLALMEKDGDVDLSVADWRTVSRILRDESDPAKRMLLAGYCVQKLSEAAAERQKSKTYAEYTVGKVWARLEEEERER